MLLLKKAKENEFLTSFEKECIGNSDFTKKVFLHLLTSLSLDGSDFAGNSKENSLDESEYDSVLILLEKLISIKFKYFQEDFFSDLFIKNINISSHNTTYFMNPMERLLQLILCKMTFFIPNCGIKNINASSISIPNPDHENSYQYSVVTSAYLFRLLNTFITATSELQQEDFDINSTIYLHMENILSVFNATNSLYSNNFNWTVKMISFFSDYKRNLENSNQNIQFTIKKDQLIQNLHVFHTVLESTLKNSLSIDGFFYSYNLIKLSHNSLKLHHLPVNIEQQDAFITSGFMTPSQIQELLSNIRKSSVISEKNMKEAVENFIPEIKNNIEQHKLLYKFSKNNTNNKNLNHRLFSASIENGCLQFNHILASRMKACSIKKYSYAPFGIPVTYNLINESSNESILIKKDNGDIEKISGNKINQDISKKILSNDGNITSIDVFFYQHGLIG